MTGWVSDPEGTLRWATEVLTDPAATAARRATAWHAAAVAHLALGEPERARRAARRALAIADSAELRLVLAWIEQDSGNAEASMRHLDAAQPRLRGALLARARCVRGLNQCVAGEYGAAHRELSVAITGARRHDDKHWLANALNARGVVRTYLRRLAAADRDLLAAQALFTSLGQRERAAVCVHNRGFVALQGGNVPEALRLFDRAISGGLRSGRRAEALIDRAYAMIGAGLLADAGEVLAQAGNVLDDAGRSMRLAEATLALGECAARAGRRDAALAAARRARELFRAQNRMRWQTAAEALERRLTVTPASLAPARSVARRCVRHGLRLEAAELRLAAAEVADPDEARELLRLVEVHRGGSARLRTLGWLARARLARLDGDRLGVFAACRAGGGVDELGELAVATALAAGDAAGVLHWLGSVPLKAVNDTLGGRALVVYVEHDGLFAVSVVDGQVRLHALGECPDVEGLRFALASGARTGTAVPVGGGVEDVLLAPLRPVLGERPLVVVPSERLRGLPWAAVDRRPICVAPTVSAWLRAVRAPRVSGHSVWVAGPGLDGADREVTELHKRWGGTVLTGRESTVDAVLAALDGAAVVHIAAHCHFRPDNPAYSYLELADGPLHAHAITGPRLLVLSACEAAPAFLRGDLTTVIASTLPVPDATAAALVTDVHEHLRGGSSPAEALAEAQAWHGDRGFVCIGAG
jgi:tetratricopeptide (TPR) repeat protein